MGLKSRNAGLVFGSRDSGDRVPPAETGQGRKGGCSEPGLVGLPGLSETGEAEPIRDNPIRDKKSRDMAAPQAWLSHGLAHHSVPAPCWDV